jgi:hypothetical protein
MKRSNDLLKLEKKLETASYDEIVLNKFKCLKPEISNTSLTSNKSFLNNIGSFIDQFKKSNDEILNDPDKVKSLAIEDNCFDKKKNYIELNLGLGVLEVKDKCDDENLLTKVINNQNDNLDIDIGEKELMDFILKNNKGRIGENISRKRIHKLKK